MFPIFFVSGPPGAGKTTLAGAVLERFERGVHIPVDDLRLWVTSGLADSVPWTDETERQFQVAEESAVEIARRYQDAGFAVVIDHCRNLPRLNDLHESLSGRPVIRVLLLPDKDTNLRRNAERTNKEFDPAVLIETIIYTNDTFREADKTGWIIIDNSDRLVEDCVDALMACTG